MPRHWKMGHFRLSPILLNIYLWKFTKVPLTWYVALGSTATFLVGYGASFVSGSRGAAD